MLDKEIDSFFVKLKENWKRKKIKPAMSIEIKDELIKECNLHYSLSNWLSYAANNAVKRALSSHPSKFTHPDVGASRTNIKKKTYVSPVIYLGSIENDGYIKTGNVLGINLDSTGNGAEVGSIGEIGSFLSLILTDGKRLYEHLKADTEEVKQLLSYSVKPYSELKDGLLSTIKEDKPQTSSKIKQVYFPVADDYHQLSLLTNSGMVYELRKRIDTLRFSEEVKDLREKKRKIEFSEKGYSEIYGLTTIGYGGTKPQNISVLNNQNGGKAHLLSSLPPSIENRNVHFPKSNFFIETLRKRDYSKLFHDLHNIIKIEHNNINIRDGRDNRIQAIIDQIIDKMWLVRAISTSQFHKESSSLSEHQHIWLHSDYVQQRVQEDQWLDKLTTDISRWIVRTYEKLLGKQAIHFGEQETLLVSTLVEQNKEALR